MVAVAARVVEVVAPVVPVGPPRVVDVVAPATVVVVDEVVVGTTNAHDGAVKVSLISVTAPFLAKARPSTDTPLFNVIEVRARMLPTNTELLPRVAELPTCQKTLQAWAPPISDTTLADAVVKVELVWKMKTEFGSPCPSSVYVPVRLRAPFDSSE